MRFIYGPAAYEFVVGNIDDTAQIRVCSRKIESHHDACNQQRLEHRFRNQKVNQFCAGFTVHAKDEAKVLQAAAIKSTRICSTQKGAAFLPSLSVSNGLSAYHMLFPT